MCVCMCLSENTIFSAAVRYRMSVWPQLNEEDTYLGTDLDIVLSKSDAC